MKLSEQYERLSTNRQLDYDIHGILVLQLVDPSESDVKSVTRQLGLTPTYLDREPDIVIHFTENLPTPGLKYLGLNFAGFTDEGFYILGSGREIVKLRIPFEDIGSQCKILCESGLPWIPLLSYIINLTLMKKNYIPLHASAFHYNGSNILATGWEKGGKTEALLSFARHGAFYIGDEWVLLSEDGQKMFGIPTPLCVWEWQFRQVPDLIPKISSEKKILFKGIHSLDGLYNAFARGRLKQFFPLKILKEALPAFKRQLKVRISPKKMFINYSGATEAPDIIFLMMSHNDSSIKIEACNPREIVERMTNSNEYEFMPLFEYYKAFKFAFPHLRNDFLENINKLQLALLSRALEGKKTYKVLHPYPVSFEALFEQMQPFCERIPVEINQEKSI